MKIESKEKYYLNLTRDELPDSPPSSVWLTIYHQAGGMGWWFANRHDNNSTVLSPGYEQYNDMFQHLCKVVFDYLTTGYSVKMRKVTP